MIAVISWFHKTKARQQERNDKAQEKAAFKASRDTAAAAKMVRKVLVSLQIWGLTQWIAL